ncbi:TIGR04255 family protein [Pelagicoccus mobilis]|uniref:TIGR04255 family protein n=1 Tax=Pelagicoccus mobilis TaxID=415221 RepID=A0A934RXG4_9BACT|nr:TIGR04255 family protein [Pelagicoccus mobilis]MBK1877260.1 TIGR04255 family protein [Pelagicoccus mobilis]
MIEPKSTVPNMRPAPKDKHPLVLALCQVSFTPVMKMEDYIPSLQDVLRKSGFPKYSKHVVSSFNFEMKPGVMDKPTQKDEIIWEFVNSDDSRSVVVTQSSIAVIILRREYSNSENFLESVLHGYGNLHDLAKPLHVTRIGLRYVDLVEPQAGLPRLDDCLMGNLYDDSFLADEAHSGHSHLQKRMRMKNGSLLTLNLRATDAPNAKVRVLSPDFQLFSLRPNFKLEAEGPHAVIDIDNSFTFTEPNENVLLDNVIAHFRALHRHHKEAFRSATTEELRNAYDM